MRWAFVALFVLLTVAAAGEEAYPYQGLTPPQKVGGLVSIQGMPLPPVDPGAIRSAIKVYEPIVAGVRLLGLKPALARGYATLATMHAALGEMEKANEYFDKAQGILEKEGAEEGFSLAWVYNNRGRVQMENGEHADAVRLFRKAAAILDSRRDDFQEPRAIVLQNLGSSYCLLGDYENSENAYLDSLELMRVLNREGTPTHQNMRGNLALLYASIGDFAAAREILERLIDERGVSRMLRFQVLNSLGYIAMNGKAFAEAEARLLEAKALAAKEPSWRALVLMNLTSTYALWRRFDRAEATGEEALQLARQIHGENSRSAAAAMGSLGTTAFGRGDLLKADRLFSQVRRILSKNPGDLEVYISVTRGLALVAQRRGQQERALTLSREGLDLAKKHLERMLAFGTEAQRHGYQSQSFPYDQLANLGDPHLLAEAAVAMKGAVLESLLAERALARKARAPADQEQLDRIHALKVEIMEKIGRGAPIEQLQRELRREEAGLAKRLASEPYPTRPRTDLSVVRAALDRDEVLIEVIRYQRYGERGELTPSYGAIVIPAAGSPRWVALRESEDLDRRIETLVGLFEKGGRSVAVLNPADGDVIQTLRELNDRLWVPLAKVIPEGSTRILLSPDAATCFLPWAGLLDEDERFLAERWKITQVGSSRHLPRIAQSKRGTTLVAFGYGEDLRHSRLEVQKIAKAAEREGWSTTVLLGNLAAENELQRHPRPGILHLATHAGQLSGDAAQPLRNRLSRNPMYRGYLLLGGGKETLEAWKTGAVAPFSNDGVLTAEEASGLDLSDTWLTVLSACETGAGDVRAGEGVLGLRRGFALAGSKNLVFSLWSVRDDATAEFMTAFYERLLQGGDPPNAFQETQLAELLRWKQERDIPSAVYRAGGFVLTQ